MTRMPQSGEYSQEKGSGRQLIGAKGCEEEMACGGRQDSWNPGIGNRHCSGALMIGSRNLSAWSFLGRCLFEMPGCRQ